MSTKLGAIQCHGSAIQMTTVLSEAHALPQSQPPPPAAYLDLCPLVVPAGRRWTSRVSEDRFDNYTERYDLVVLLTELLNQFAVRCVRNATSGASLSTHYVPALITGLRGLNPLDIAELVGKVSIDNAGGRGEVFGTLRSGARDCLLATITVLSLKARRP